LAGLGDTLASNIVGDVVGNVLEQGAQTLGLLLIEVAALD